MSTLVRFQPWRELATLQNEMSRFMNGVLDSPARVAQSWVPAVDVWETESEVVYAFDLPGVAEDAIEIEAHDETLTVSAKRESTVDETQEGVHRVERRFGSFSRAIALPQGADAEKIAALYENGVLEIRVPKPEAAKPRKISVALGSKPADIDAEPGAAA